MPQLDKVTYFSQVATLISSFVLFYFIIVKRNLTDTAKILKLRSKLLKKLESNSQAILDYSNTSNSLLKDALKESNLIIAEATSQAQCSNLSKLDTTSLNTLIKLTLIRKGLIQIARGKLAKGNK